ncbi:hypothetical protein HMPREF1982_01281 [Clostridiales bacterium oral taxon 876 str. F0540]|nr:hypothetical protein HMPREF1982_01281 [Clostridiales bacterium oral taxon 876 str. F0540]
MIVDREYIKNTIKIACAKAQAILSYVKIANSNCTERCSPSTT